MPDKRRTPALAGVRGSGFRQASRLDGPEDNAPTREFQSAGQVASEIVERMAIQRQAEHLHRCGARAIGELLLELIEAHGEAFRVDLLHRLQAYGRLNPDVLAALGGDRFPVPALHSVVEAA